ncbi:MAG: hypothetical protein JSV52_09335 [Candidatus Zixiibacteriota bacterium]|nr:MAG: hypothetical protein JSV52_09335 [candidate division Zixibacteria bacterium]
MATKIIQSRVAKWGLLISALAVFALISGLYLPGCSENPAIPSGTDLSQDETSFFDQPFDEAAFARAVELQAVVDVEVLYEEGLFTSLDGGEIVIGTAGNFQEFVVYPYSVPYDVTISLEITSLQSKKNDDVAIVYEFKPDGLEFLIPAELKINVAKVLGKRATCLRWYYLNEQTGIWVYQGQFCADPETGFATVPVEHFSRYGAE